jgi:hypothetical protein
LVAEQLPRRLPDLQENAYNSSEVGVAYMNFLIVMELGIAEFADNNSTPQFRLRPDDNNAQLARELSEQKMFRTKVLEKREIYIFCSGGASSSYFPKVSERGRAV